jgi:hypothetical protein
MEVPHPCIRELADEAMKMEGDGGEFAFQVF